VRLKSRAAFTKFLSIFEICRSSHLPFVNGIAGVLLSRPSLPCCRHVLRLVPVWVDALPTQLLGALPKVHHISYVVRPFMGLSSLDTSLFLLAQLLVSGSDASRSNCGANHDDIHYAQPSRASHGFRSGTSVALSRPNLLFVLLYWKLQRKGTAFLAPPE